MNGIAFGKPCSATDRKLREGTRRVVRGWFGRGAPKAPGGLSGKKIALDCKWEVERRHDSQGNITYFRLRAIGGLGEVGLGFSSKQQL
jgi:hypothetical protein